MPINSSEPITPQARVSFIDISKFDRELASSVDSPLESVDVVFYDRVGPNNMPERLQKWLAAVEKNGGVVRVVQVGRCVRVWFCVWVWVWVCVCVVVGAG